MKIKGEKVNIRPKKPTDAKNDYRWQSDPELSALDAMTPLTLSFRDYYQEYIETLKHPFPNRITFAVDTKDGRHIGNCVYYNIDKMIGETEIGIMIGERDYWNNGYGTDIISTLIDYIFQRLKFQRVYLKTLKPTSGTTVFPKVWTKILRIHGERRLQISADGHVTFQVAGTKK